MTPARNICSVSASYSSFVFVMRIVALRRLSLSPGTAHFLGILMVFVAHDYRMRVTREVVDGKHTAYDARIRISFEFSS